MTIRKFNPGDQVVFTEKAVKSLTDKTMYGRDAYTYPPRAIFTVKYYISEYSSDVYIHPRPLEVEGSALWSEVWLKKWQ